MPADTPELKHARHQLRGRINALKLSISALEVVQEPKEVLEFLGYIEEGADTTITAIDDFERAQDQANV